MYLQKSRRWCFIEFRDEETLQKVREALKQKEINGKKLIVKPYTFAGRKRPQKSQQKLHKKVKTESKQVNTSAVPLLNLLIKQE